MHTANPETPAPALPSAPRRRRHGVFRNGVGAASHGDSAAAGEALSLSSSPPPCLHTGDRPRPLTPRNERRGGDGGDAVVPPAPHFLRRTRGTIPASQEPPRLRRSEDL